MLTLLLRLTLSGSVFILAVLVLRVLFLHRAPKLTFPVLWGVALFRLLVPFSPPSPLSLLTALDRWKTAAPPVPAAVPAVQAAVDAAPVYYAPAAGAGAFPAVTVSDLGAAVHQAAFPEINLLLAVWLLGMVSLGLFFLFHHLRCRREYRTALPVDSPFVARWLVAHPLRRPVRVLCWDRLAAPITYGILRPVVLLPVACLEDEEQLGYIMTHEFTHIRRFDALYKWVMAGALCLHWLNPLVWLLYVLAGRDLELSCDEAVLKACREDSRQAYALALLCLEEKRSLLSAPFASGFSKTALEERIRAIMKTQKTTRAGIALSVALVLTATAVFATDAPNKEAPQAASNPPASSAAMPGTPQAASDAPAPSAATSRKEGPPTPSAAPAGKKATAFPAEAAPVTYDQALFQYGIPREEMWASAVDVTEASQSGGFMYEPFTYSGKPVVYRIGVTQDLPLIWIYLENPSEEYWQFAVYTPSGKPCTMGGMNNPHHTIECPPGSFSYSDDPEPQYLYLVLYREEHIGDGTFKLYNGTFSGTVSVRQEQNWRTLCQYLAPEAYKTDPKNIWFTTQSNSRSLDFAVTKEAPVFRVWTQNTGEHDYRIMVKDADGNVMSTKLVRPGEDAAIEGAYGGEDSATYTILITSPISWYVEGVFSYRTGGWNDGVWNSLAN